MIRSNPLEELLAAETSLRNTEMVADLILQQPVHFDQLMKIFLKNEEPVSRRAAWVADTITEKVPGLLSPYLTILIQNLEVFSHDGMKRHSLRMLNRYAIPEKMAGKLISTCFRWLITPGESVAVKVFSMDLLYKISQSEPDLKQELADSIRWRMDEETPGFRSKGAKILKKLSREMNLQGNQ